MSAVASEKSAFEDLFEETIMSSIRDLLGESSMRAILFHLSMESVATDPQMFDQKMRELLKEPAVIIEEVIIKDLFKRLDVMYAPSGAFSFEKYVKAAQKAYAKQEERRLG